MVASGLHARCAEHRWTECPSIIAVPSHLPFDLATGSIDLTERLVSVVFSADTAHEGDVAFTLTYEIDLTDHQVDEDRVALDGT